MAFLGGLETSMGCVDFCFNKKSCGRECEMMIQSGEKLCIAMDPHQVLVMALHPHGDG